MLQLMLNAHNDTEHDDETTHSMNDKKGAIQHKALSADDVMAQVIYICRTSVILRRSWLRYFAYGTGIYITEVMAQVLCIRYSLLRSWLRYFV